MGKFPGSAYGSQGRIKGILFALLLGMLSTGRIKGVRPSQNNCKSENIEAVGGGYLITNDRGKVKLIEGNGADQFYFAGEEPFKKKTVDKVIDFDSSEGDAIVIADEVVGDLTDDPTLVIADTKKDLKQLSKDGYDLLTLNQKAIFMSMVMVTRRALARSQKVE